jgi:hypothetical protein
MVQIFTTSRMSSTSRTSISWKMSFVTAEMRLALELALATRQGLIFWIRLFKGMVVVVTALQASKTAAKGLEE